MGAIEVCNHFMESLSYSVDALSGVLDDLPQSLGDLLSAVTHTLA